MWIISQDKEEIANTDRADSIWICSDEEGRFSIEATADTNATLGYYKTEERAKEVLQEIIKAIVEIRKAKDANDFFGFPTMPADTYYEMPEE